MSETFSYQFTDQTTKATDTIVVAVSTPATNSTGYGLGYAVTAVGGFIGSTAIPGEIGTGGKIQTDSINAFGYDDIVFGSSNNGKLGSANGIDNDGIESISGGNKYNLFTNNGGFQLLTVAGSAVGDPLTLVSTDAPCFCRGTRIATPGGEVVVERLRVGDLVVGRSGAARPLTWVGRGRSLVTAANPNARPIVVRAGALADGVPVRDLHLTRRHSLLLDGVLIPVEYADRLHHLGV